MNFSNQNDINFAQDHSLHLNAKKLNLLPIHTAQTKHIETSYKECMQPAQRSHCARCLNYSPLKISN